MAQCARNPDVMLKACQKLNDCGKFDERMRTNDKAQSKYFEREFRLSVKSKDKFELFDLFTQVTYCEFVALKA